MEGLAVFLLLHGFSLIWIQAGAVLVSEVRNQTCDDVDGTVSAIEDWDNQVETCLADQIGFKQCLLVDRETCDCCLTTKDSSTSMILTDQREAILLSCFTSFFSCLAIKKSGDYVGADFR